MKLVKAATTQCNIVDAAEVGLSCQQRNQTLAQMAIAWVLRHPGMAYALVGASKVCQIEDSLVALDCLKFSESELSVIEQILSV